MLAKSTSSPRRTHRKRVSALHLSTDTTATLPEYYQASASASSWHRHSQDASLEDDTPSDKPPDYSDSAEEADEDTDSENHRNTLFVHQLPSGTSTLPRTPQTAPSTTSPRRKQRFSQHKRKHSAPVLTKTHSDTSPVDPYLDALLERSVHALEMSNTLLQSSMTTQSSLSTVLACDSPADTTLEARAVNLSTRIRGQWDTQPTWMGDLEEITRRVNSLFGESVVLNDDRAEGNGPNVGSGHNIRSKDDWSRSMRSSFTAKVEAGLSSSLPTAPSPLRQRLPRPRPSLDLRNATAETGPSGSARLRLSHRTREDLVAPPPRAVTQYIEPGDDSAFVTLPSTLGVRSGPSLYPNAEWNASTSSLHSSPALPVVTDTPLPSSSTPAYTKLASFVIKQPSHSTNGTPCSSFTSSFSIKRRNSSAGSSERGRRMSPHRSPQPLSRRSLESARSHTSTNTTSPLSHQHRPMTPPAEESSSSSDGCVAKQTISSLRKILDEQPEPKYSPKKNRNFMPVTPPPPPVSGTSTATASISRMLTKKLHHSSTRPPSPPRQSAMKGSRPTTPSSTSGMISPPPSSSTFVGETLSIPERIAAGWQSTTSSGRSTPKRISFAELPEAHISSRPEKFKDKGKRKGKGKSYSSSSKLKGKSRVGASDEEDSLGWFAALFGLNPSLGGPNASRQEERMEDRISRSWGGRAGGGGYGYMDEWAV